MVNKNDWSKVATDICLRSKELNEHDTTKYDAPTLSKTPMSIILVYNFDSFETFKEPMLQKYSEISEVKDEDLELLRMRGCGCSSEKLTHVPNRVPLFQGVTEGRYHGSTREDSSEVYYVYENPEFAHHTVPMRYKGNKSATWVLRHSSRDPLQNSDSSVNGEKKCSRRRMIIIVTVSISVVLVVCAIAAVVAIALITANKGKLKLFISNVLF